MDAPHKTPWTDTVGEKPLQEYPRPQFVRDSYVNLNGRWKYKIDREENVPDTFDGDILVPFSPETALSGVGRKVLPGEYLHYSTLFILHKNFNRGVVLLHFGAVDSRAEVFVNGFKAGSHEGGYTAFTLEITAFLREGENRLDVTVRDDTDRAEDIRGKQRLKPGGIWYTAQSGIWQTVWLESVAPQYIRGARLTPLFDENALLVELDKVDTDTVTVHVFDGEREVAARDTQEDAVIVPLPPDIRPWTPEEPKLYDVVLVSRRDKVKSYFGMRKFSLGEKDGHTVTMLNNKPYFFNGLLDQGYWCDGLYTAPCDEALVFDIETAKQLGFNTLRKHVKTEPMRWYYHCDRLGMLVWQDMVNGGGRQNKWITLYLPFLGKNNIRDSRYRLFAREDKKGREKFKRQLAEMTDQLYNCVSLAVWTPFNEGWGQFDAAEVAAFVKERDNTRLVDHASGWHDQQAGDFKSLHVYLKKVRLPKKEKRALALTEFGGFAYCEEGHGFAPDKKIEYKLFKTREEWIATLEKTYARDVAAQMKKGLTAAVYTQLTDVEGELNGLVTYDRKKIKADVETMRKINAGLRFE